MDKRKLHHLWTKVRAVRPAYLLALTLIGLVMSVVALRANNQHMLELRDKVFAADEAGGDVQKSLKDLQAYVTTHMNTDLSTGKNPVYPPIQLKHTYEELVRARSEEFAKANSQLYNDAQHYCEQQNSTDFSGRNRVPCITQYVESHSTQKLPPIPDDLYKFSFASPKWSPDLAGWSLVFTALSGLAFVVLLLSRWWLKLASR